jgi:serine protease AprX
MGMADRIVVRLVPKNRSRAPLQEIGFSAVIAAPQGLQPEPRMARSAVGWLSERRVEVRPTPTSRIELEMNRTEFEALFSTTLEAGSYSGRSEGRRTLRETFERPKEALKVPDGLAGTIDFAYVPRPVEFYAPPSYLPPIEMIEYLRLEDVRAALNAARAHRQGWNGAGVKVAMVDSGFFAHPFFAANGYKLIPSASPDARDPEKDKSGHGTGECANIFTVAPDATVYGVKSGLSAATALEAAIALGPDVMSNSWGYDVDHQSRDQLRADDPNFFNELLDIETILSDAVRSGIVVLFSAGNGHRAFPACMPQIIAVGGVTVLPDGALQASSYASSFESQLYPGRSVPDICGIVGSSTNQPPLPHHIMLPVPPGSDLDGENFPSGRSGLGWGIFSGTSAACPQVAGAVALMRGILKGAKADQVRTALIRTATDVTKGKTATGDAAKAGPDLATGPGLVNVRAACEFIASVV